MADDLTQITIYFKTGPTATLSVALPSDDLAHLVQDWRTQFSARNAGPEVGTYAAFVGSQACVLMVRFADVLAIA